MHGRRVKVIARSGASQTRGEPDAGRVEVIVPSVERLRAPWLLLLAEGSGRAESNVFAACSRSDLREATAPARPPLRAGDPVGADFGRIAAKWFVPNADAGKLSSNVSGLGSGAKGDLAFCAGRFGTWLPEALLLSTILKYWLAALPILPKVSMPPGDGNGSGSRGAECSQAVLPFLVPPRRGQDARLLAALPSLPASHEQL